MTSIAVIQARCALYSNETRSAEEEHGSAEVERNKKERADHEEIEDAASAEITTLEGTIETLEGKKGGVLNAVKSLWGESNKQNIEEASVAMTEEQAVVEQQEEHVAVLEEEQSETFEDIRSANQAVATSIQNMSRALENSQNAIVLEG